MRLACDTGGTFTDLILEDDAGDLEMFKASTTPDDPIRGVMDALAVAAESRRITVEDLLGQAEIFIHGTTHAINAVITGRTARTAFLTTEGHPDVLVLREGGRQDPFNFTVPFPQPYVPRALTFEIGERTLASGEVIRPLDDDAVIAICSRLRALCVEAVGVCLLWSVANPAHEIRVGELLAEHLPSVPFTLSHALNPTVREFRRASATVIDASLKPLMGSYIGTLSQRLGIAGFGGRLLVLTSQGAMVEASEIAKAPIRAINSGPSLAPVAGRHFAKALEFDCDVIVADTGGTTYDVSLVRGGEIPLTRDAWIGSPFRGHLTGFPSVDVKSVGSGGGSIARVDEGGLLRVGPMSAGAFPGPVCYGRGGDEPTLTDACLVLGYIDAEYFLGGSMSLDLAAAKDALSRRIAAPLGISLEDAATAVLALATENMVQAIADITVNQGIDPRRAVLIGGGGAAGLNSVFIAKRLGIPVLIIPEVGPALSAAGALMSELAADYRAIAYVTTSEFDCASANEVLNSLKSQAQQFLEGAGSAAFDRKITLSVEARYEQQVWEIVVPLPVEQFNGAQDISAFVEAMHVAHERLFAFRDQSANIEIIGWSARASCRVHQRVIGRLPKRPSGSMKRPARSVCFPGAGSCLADVVAFDDLPLKHPLLGPAIIESPFTTIVVDPASTYERRPDGSLVINTRTEIA